MAKGTKRTWLCRLDFAVTDSDITCNSPSGISLLFILQMNKNGTKFQPGCLCQQDVPKADSREKLLYFCIPLWSRATEDLDKWYAQC